MSKTTTKQTSAGNTKERIPLRITDTTLRDAHQSLWATRMRSSDIMEIIDVIDNVGFYSLEVWGGATFDVCLRFLRENPWERLRQIKAKAKKTPLQMLLRGQNVLGYKNYADDLLDRFISIACENGIDIFRIFDALNDTRNLEQAIKSVKKHGGHAQGTICYTISPVHTVDKYVEIAKEQASLGVDSLVIKDMAGILSPISAERLVSALVREVKLPIQMHCHATSGMATATYVEGVRAGAGAIDCAISVMSCSSSQPPHETMLSIFDETSYHANLDRDGLRRMNKYFTDLVPHRMLDHQPINPIDPEILIHHIPGGMISNLRSQLEKQDALDRLEEVLTELPKVRADMGYPPLVTPTSQIVGVQAVMNVLSGERYSMVPQETKNYVKGLYGRSPAPIDPKIKKKILGKEKAITCRPADLLGPMLPDATDNVDPELIKSEEDIISFCLFPEPALEYFKWRNIPPAERPPSPADIERKEMDDGNSDAPAEPERAFLAAQDYEKINIIIDKVEELGLTEIIIRRNDLELSMKASGVSTRESASRTHDSSKPLQAKTKPEVSTADTTNSKTAANLNSTALSINAPLNGTFYISSGPAEPALASIGDVINAGDPVCIVEAMKLFNQIKAPSKCKILDILTKHGDAVKKNQPLILIEEL